MNPLLHIGTTILIILSAIIIIANKIFFPNHRIISVVLFLISLIPLILSFSQQKNTIIRTASPIIQYAQLFKIHIVVGIILLFLIYLVLILLPLEKSPLLELNKSQLNSALTDDMHIVIYLDKRFASILNQEITQTLNNQLDPNDANTKNKLLEFWASYSDLLIELDLLKERYRTFYQLPDTPPDNLRARAFLNGYTSRLMQNHYTINLSNLEIHPTVLTYLNEQHPDYKLPKNSLNNTLSQLAYADNHLKLNGGLAYYKIVPTSSSPLVNLITHYQANINNSLKSYSIQTVKRPLRFLEKTSTDSWSPIQKNIAENISYIRATNRDYLITPDIIKKHTEKLQPGDILLQRREWHATNIGIPGYWTHLALYIGAPEKLDEHFKNIPELNNSTFTQHIKQKYPRQYKAFIKKDTKNNPMSVIESKRPGVIFESLEDSANADALAILRIPHLSKSEQFHSIINAIKHYGKPYDYKFDFTTDNALVCSELVYKSFSNVHEFPIKPQLFNGKLLIMPNELAQAYAQQTKNTPLFEFVLFLDGHEDSHTVAVKSAEEFSTTWTRPKWYNITN